MTQYEKLNFVNGSPPALNAATLNHMEDGIAAVTEGVTAVEKTVKDNKTETDTALAKKPDKATTLAGYSITNAYTKTEVDTKLSGKLDDTSGSVTTNNIASKAVTSVKIADGAVTVGKIGVNAVLPDNIASGSISKDKLSISFQKEINGKANSATTLEGYRITDAYTKAEVDGKFTAAEKSANKLSVDYVVTDPEHQYPSMAYMFEHYYDFSETEDLLGEKYDASNVEYGIGTLTPGSTTTEKVSSADFVYQRTGNAVLINFNIVLNNASASRLIFSNLPFVCSDFSDVYEYNLSSTGRIFEAKISKANSTLLITPKENEEFIPGETLAFTIKYFIS